MAQRKPLGFIIQVITAAAAAYIFVTAFEGYHPKAPTCLDTALSRGVESMPSYCKFPIWQCVIGALILGFGTSLAKRFTKSNA